MLNIASNSKLVGLNLLDLEVKVLLGVEDKNSIRKINPY